ncbi:hypothetical protein V2G26_008558 [Clonostachys chloroleuca]
MYIPVLTWAAAGGLLSLCRLKGPVCIRGAYARLSVSLPLRCGPTVNQSSMTTDQPIQPPWPALLGVRSSQHDVWSFAAA